MPSDVRTNRCHGRSESGGHKHFNGWGRSISRSLYRLCLAAITVPGGPESPCGGRICEDDDLRGGEGHLAGGAHGIGEEVSGVSRAPFRRLTAAFSIPSRGAGRPFCEQRDRRDRGEKRGARPLRAATSRAPRSGIRRPWRRPRMPWGTERGAFRMVEVILSNRSATYAMRQRFDKALRLRLRGSAPKV